MSALFVNLLIGAVNLFFGLTGTHPKLNAISLSVAAMAFSLAIISGVRK